MHTKTEKGFASTLLRLMLPIVLQNLLSAVVSTADVLMLSDVGQQALSSSSLAGQVTFVLTLFYMGISTGASVLSAQYWGKKDTVSIEKIQGLALRLSMVVSVVFFLAALCIPRMLMRLFTAETELQVLGAIYLRAVSASYLIMGASQVLLAVLRSVEETRLCAGISASCLVCNIALNALAIYVVFPGNQEGALAGVALATTLSRALELALCLAAIARGKGVRIRLSATLHTEKWLMRDFTRCTLPVQSNYLIWGGATAVIASIMGHMGSDVVAANSLATTLRGLVIVGCSGLSAAGSILLGKALGAQKYAEAEAIGKRLFTWSLLLGAAAGALLLLLYVPCKWIANLEPGASALFGWMLVVNAVYCIGKSFNSCIVAGVFCAGGDTQFGLICDTVAMWGVVLPLGALTAFGLNWPPVAVYIVLCMDEFVKLPFVVLRFFKKKWIQNLTHDSQTTA